MLTRILINQHRQLISRSTNQFRSFASTTNKQEDILSTSMSKPIDKSKFHLDDDDEELTPVVYSQSKASTKKAADEFRFANEAAPPSQWYFVTFSTAAFLIYFCILREENDLDEILYSPFAGNEKIYKSILQIQQKKSSDSDRSEITKKIAELDAIIDKKEEIKNAKKLAKSG